MRLQQSLNTKVAEIEKFEAQTIDLSNKIFEYEIITQTQYVGNDKLKSKSSTRLMSTKIVELSKKLREKTSEVENYKSIIGKLQQRLLTESAKTEKNNSPEQKEECKENKAVDESSDIIKSLQDKINMLNTKLFDSKNQNLILKNDLKLAKKILAEELGDNFISIQNYSSNSASWRGRAQQITYLQQKNSELLERLSVNGTNDRDINSAKSDMNNKKLIIDQLNKDLNTTKNELEECKKKLNASKARIKVLESECSSIKFKLTSQNEKIKNDEQIIGLLKNQISYLEENQNTTMKESQVNWETQVKNLSMDLKKEKCIVDNLKFELKEKDNSINELKNEIKIFQNEEEKSVYNASNKDLQSKVKILEVEVNRLSELVAVLNLRLEEERKQATELQINYRKERQLAAKLETKVLRLEMESNIYKSQSYSKSSLSRVSSTYIPDDTMTVESLKNSLELSQENIKAVESRLTILQREKEMDFQRFRAILNDIKDIKNAQENSV